jgi:hypothetical protein
MPDTSWALVHDDGRPAVHVAGLLISCVLADPAGASIEPLLARWAGYVNRLAPDGAFAATADNVAVLDDELRLACDLRAGVEPLDLEATRARLCWHLARTLVVAGAAGDPAMPVHELASRLAGRCGWSITDASLARALAHEAELRATLDVLDPVVERERIHDENEWTMPIALSQGAMVSQAIERALAAAWADLVRTRHDRDVAEAAAIELHATRALALSLGEELHRDEWIRARLRKVKATRPFTLAIDVRKRILRRP